MALDEADAYPTTDGQPSYYHSEDGIICFCQAHFTRFSLAVWTSQGDTE
jgi:hypothetical protein